MAAELGADDFEGYAVGDMAVWDLGAGAPVVDESTFAGLGSPNKCLDLTDSGRRMFKDLSVGAPGAVTTFSCDFVELSGTAATSGLQVGYAEGSDINIAGGAVRVSLGAGVVAHQSLGGLSSVTESGTGTYSPDQAHRLQIVVNDTASPLTDYFGTEDLAAHSYEVWLWSGGAVEKALEATVARDPKHAGLRSWSGFDAAFHVDNVRIESGANVAPVGIRCSFTPSADAVPNGAGIVLDWSATGLPAGSGYEIASTGGVVFPNGDASGDASGGGGQVEAVMGGAHREVVAFTLTFRDTDDAVIRTSQCQVVIYDYSLSWNLPHPSVTSSGGQLSAMKNQVLNAPGSLARAGWDAMRTRSYASLAYVPTPQTTVTVVPSGTNQSETAFRNDGQAARAHALQWVVTGDPAHRDMAVGILSDWGRAFENMVSTGSSAQVQLECAWALPVWLGAADILRYHDGGAANWDEADMAAFNHFADIMASHAEQALARTNNWAVSASLAIMSYGAWIDDPAVFETGLARQLELLDSISQTDGEIEETCRDTWHPQYSVVSFIDSAELARNLGRPDLYEAVFDGQDTPRLAIILEYFSNLFLGNTQHPCGGGWGYDYLGEYDRFDNYEVAYNHYVNRIDAPYLPVFREMVEDFWRNDVGEDAHFLLWSRLTHGDNGHAPVPPPDNYGAWKAEHFTSHGITDPALTDPSADYNHDGISNALHYWTLTDPRIGTGEALVAVDPAAGTPEQFRITFVERAGAAAYGRIFLFSDDLSAPLSTWSAVTPASIEILEDRGAQVLRRASLPVADSRGFVVVAYPGLGP